MTSATVSPRGRVSVAYAPWIWIPCPPDFHEGVDLSSWAAHHAHEWWANSGQEHGEPQVRLLATMLAEMHDYAYANLPMHQGVIHLPETGLAPLLVSFGFWAATGERTAQLRALVHADDPDAIRPPEVSEFATERLGPGLKSLVYTRTDVTLSAHLCYAWRSEELGTAVRMFTACPDLGRLHRALPDIEQLARFVTINPVEPGSS
ncbi:MAG TPA: hypothetical protein VMU95_33425 [Trebonia sp.]|nr:hypothetical protein [Trebonia sp.]